MDLWKKQGKCYILSSYVDYKWYSKIYNVYNETLKLKLKIVNIYANKYKNTVLCCI